MAYQFNTAKEGDVFYVKFIKANGETRRMCAQFVKHEGNVIRVTDLDLNEGRSIRKDRVLSVMKVMYKAQPLYMKKEDSVDYGYTWEKLGSTWNVFYNDELIGTAYKQEQVQKIVDFHKSWKK